jgi:hypothetical protein
MKNIVAQTDSSPAHRDARASQFEKMIGASNHELTLRHDPEMSEAKLR